MYQGHWLADEFCYIIPPILIAEKLHLVCGRLPSHDAVPEAADTACRRPERHPLCRAVWQSACIFRDQR